ncbi:MAG: ATP-binding protein [Bacillota bacterium]
MPSLFSRLFRKERNTVGKQFEREVRIAVYDSLATVPRIVDVRSRNVADLLNELASKTYTFAHEKGSRLPYVAIKEIVENLLHADFEEAVITILPDGNTIRVSDQGPGIIEKERAFLPGFTTATAPMKKLIRGVGSGLPIVRDSMQAVGGSVLIDDNLRRGCVVTLSCLPQGAKGSSSASEKQAAKTALGVSGGFHQPERGPDREPGPGLGPGDRPSGDEMQSMEHGKERAGGKEKLAVEKLDDVISARQRKVFMVVAERSEVGPSTIVKELDISLSTAYRDLVALEECGLVEPCDNTGKRRLTQRGMAYLARLAK